MSSKGGIDVFVNGLPEPLRVPLKQAFYYVLEGFRLGTARRAENAQLYRYTATTHGTAQTEFVIPHGLDVAPQQLIPILDLQAVNAQLVPLQTSRAADSVNLYLKSSSTGAVVFFFLEA
jgi:hypothetical protein